MFRLLIAACLGLLLVPSFSPADALVGVAKVDITPETPVRMYGYASRKTESQGIAGRLRAGALVIGGDEGEGPVVLVCVDCGAVPGGLRDEVYRRVKAKAAIKPERFMLCNSHNHSGPNLKGMAETEGTEREHLERYARLLTDRLEGVVVSALASRRPSRLSWTQGKVAVAANRRVLKNGKWSAFGAVPEGAVDHGLPLLRVTDPDGKLRAVVINYACHNTTLRGNFQQIHGDWAGCVQAAIESDHPGVATLVTLGCGADSDPCPHGTVALCEQHGRAMADEVKRLLSGPFRPLSGQVTARAKPLEIPYEPAPPVEELRRVAARSYPAQRLLRLIDRGEKLPTKRIYQVAAWSFGKDLAMVFLSDEVVVDYALRLKKELDGARLWVNAYSNDVSNYIVSKRLLQEGGYEVNNSLSASVTFGRPERLQPPMEERILGRVKELLPSFVTEGKSPR